MSTTNQRSGNSERRHLPGSRYRSRVSALCLLFEAESRDVDPVALAEERRDYARKLNESGEEGVSQISDYAITIVTGVAVELDRIDETVEVSLTNWTLDRLSAVDRAILRIGSWELLFASDDVPPVTAVDEAVALAREYSSDDAPSFVNAVLDRVLAVARSAQAASVLRDNEAQQALPEEENSKLNSTDSNSSTDKGSDINTDDVSVEEQNSEE